MRLEVRCCCQPQKLLGYLQVSPNELACGYIRRAKLTAAAFSTPESFAPEAVNVEIVTLPIAYIIPPRSGWERAYKAVKAEGKTPEELRHLQGWEDA